MKHFCKDCGTNEAEKYCSHCEKDLAGTTAYEETMTTAPDLLESLKALVWKLEALREKGLINMDLFYDEQKQAFDAIANAKS